MATGLRADMSGSDLIVNNLTVGAAAGTGSGTGGGTQVFSGTSLSGVTIAAPTMTSVTLSAGTTSAAPLKLTAGTNLATATAGTIEYDGTCFYDTAVASARQLLDSEQFILQAGDTATSASSIWTSVTPVFGASTNGAVTLASNTAYAFEGVYNVTSTGATSHTWATSFGLGTSISLSGISYQVSALSTTTANTPVTGGLSGFVSTATSTVVTAASTSATENVSIMVTGTVRVATTGGGTFAPQLKMSALASGNVVVKDGSFFRIWPLGTQAVGFVGNWS